MKKKIVKSFVVVHDSKIFSYYGAADVYKNRKSALHEWRETPTEDYYIVPCTITYNLPN